MKTIPITASSLASISLFAKFDAELREQLASNCRGQVFEPREVILSRNATSQDVYFIIAGSVHITNFSQQGKEITFRDQDVGEAFGILAAIDGEPRSADAIAKEKTTIARMTGERFRKLLQDSPAVNAAVMNYLARLIRLLSDRVFEFSTLNVNQRLYAELLRLSDSSTTIGERATIQCMPTHADLASRVSTHREAVTRALKQLENSGVIEKDGTQVIINEVSVLKDKISCRGD
ncbi:MAG: Crp/Fnr family transcriptional regulator [Gammaproteobacteria bacterium]